MIRQHYSAVYPHLATKRVTPPFASIQVDKYLFQRERTLYWQAVSQSAFWSNEDSWKETGDSNGTMYFFTDWQEAFLTEYWTVQFLSAYSPVF